MAVLKEDRRIKRTKKMLRQALAQLMSEKDFKDITVKDITECADLNRGTFYLHYCDTYDLLEKVENELIQNLETMMENYHPTEKNQSAFVIIEQVFDYITENIEICKIMFLSNSNFNYLEKLTNIITVKGFELRKELCSDFDKEKNDYLFCFLASGIIGLIKKWFIDDMKTPKKEMVKIIDNIISNVFRPLSQN